MVSHCAPSESRQEREGEGVGNRGASHHTSSDSRQEWVREGWENRRVTPNTPEENRREIQDSGGRGSNGTTSQGTLRAAIKARRIDVLRLKTEVEEIVEGTLPLERIELYETDELLFVAKDVTRRARAAHEKLSELANKYSVDLTKTKALQSGHRLQYSDQDLEEKRVIGLKTHIRELIVGIRTWSPLEKWEERWSKRKSVRRSVLETSPGGGLLHAEAYPLREVAHGGYVHVPWSRGDLAAFTNTFPKLRESPVEWYKQVERFVKFSKVLWIDLNTQFDIVVPSDLWIACKVSVEWPTAEPERDSATNGPSPRVMAKYEQAITWLKTKVPPQDIDWVKIDRTRQEPKETVHEYYERLLLIFKQYSGLDVMDLKDMGQFVSKFVLGLRPDICLMIQQHLICWQNKPLDEILRYARYCSDEIDLKTKKLKDKLMLVQMQAGGQGQSGNGTMGRRSGGQKRDGEEGPRPRIDIEALKKTTKCHQCHEVGHWRRECPHNPDNQVQEEEEEEEVQAPPVRKVTVTKSQTTKWGTSAPRAPVPQAPKISTGSKVCKQMPFIVEGDECYQFDPVTGWYVDGEEGCTLGAVLEVDQRGPFVEADVDGHPTTFLVDTGASRSTVRSAVVPNLPLSGQTIQVVGVANRRMTNPLTEPVPVKIGSFSDQHQFVVCDSSPVCLLGRDLLCKLNCTIYCTPKGVELQTNDDDADFKVANTHTCIELYPAITVEELPWDLRDSVSPEVWDFTGEEIGLIKGVEPVRIQVRQNVEFPRTPQYKLTPETLEGIKPVIESMVRQGILKEVMGSPCNSPIMGLQKPSGKFRIVQDLRKINNIVVPCCPVVPNPSVILFQIPFQAEWFSVIDLCQAFFSIPLHEESQFLFAFKIESRVLTWCCIPQGYTESPSIFNQLLKRNLESLVLPQNSVLVQYIDDLLVASDTEDSCRIDTIALLNHLGKNGHKVSPSKLQYCLQEVQYLGHRIEKGKRKVSPDRIETIMRMSVPSTQREVRMFLGMVGYCRQWIANFSLKAKPLQKLTHKDVSDPVPWDTDCMMAFLELREDLSRAPALGMPDYTKSFALFCCERERCALAVLVQDNGGVRRRVAYFSATLDPVAAALPGCLKSVAATGVSIERCESIVMGYPLTVHIKDAADRWLKPQEGNLAEVMNKIYLEQFIEALPFGTQRWLRQHAGLTLEHAVEMANSYARAQNRPMVREPEKPNSSKLPVKTDRKPNKNPIEPFIKARPVRLDTPLPTTPQCYECREWGHIARYCRKKKEKDEEPMEVGYMPRAIMYAQETGPAFYVSVQLDHKRIRALLDSGCRHSVVRADSLSDSSTMLNRSVRIKCVHGDIRTYPLARVTIVTEKGTQVQCEVGVLPKLPEALIIGTDNKWFTTLMSEVLSKSTTGPESKSGLLVEEPWATDRNSVRPN
ncbi:uncharacterized protein LOC144790911 [Lissotriton helveticus]